MPAPSALTAVAAPRLNYGFPGMLTRAASAGQSISATIVRMSQQQPPGWGPPPGGYGPPPQYPQQQQPYGQQHPYGQYGPPPPYGPQQPQQIIVQGGQNTGVNVLAWVIVAIIGLPLVLGLGSCVACTVCASVGSATHPGSH